MRKIGRDMLAVCMAAGLVMCGRSGIAAHADEATAFVQITMDEAQEALENAQNHLLVDVRTPEEFAEGHIPGAINVPNESIADTPIEVLPDPDQEIYVYCRSGRRSKEAAQKLSAMGYTHIIEIGGIQDWKGEIIPEALMTYTFGDGYTDEAERLAVTVSILPDMTLELSALNGAVSETTDLTEASVEELKLFVDGKLGDLQEDMSDPCVADGGFAYLHAEGKTYGGRAVQNSSFDAIGKKFKETIGQEKLDAFRAQVQEADQAEAMTE